jgi:hypothetical protein
MLTDHPEPTSSGLLVSAPTWSITQRLSDRDGQPDLPPVFAQKKSARDSQSVHLLMLFYLMLFY